MDHDNDCEGRVSTEQSRPAEQPFSPDVRSNGQHSTAKSTTPFVLGDMQERADRSYSLATKFEHAMFWSEASDCRDEESLTSTGNKHVFVSFSGLQMMRLWKLKRELVGAALSMYFSEEETSGWEDLLKEYIAAVRDDEFIRRFLDDRPDLYSETFMVNSRIAEDAKLLELELLRIPQEWKDSKGMLYEWTSINIPRPKYPLRSEDIEMRDIHIKRYQERKEKFRQTFQRMGVAILGGVFLVGPMWLMVLQNELYTTLISTTGFVFGFGLVLSLVPTFVDGAKVGLDTVMSATAAYAAVLVVFVGTTTTTTTSGA